LLRAQAVAGRLVAAVCAAPTALVAHGLFSDRAMTSHPGPRSVVSEGCREYREDRVVRDGNLITSRGPGTSFEFALEIVRSLVGDERAASVGEPMILP
jgi:protein DJ-1